MKAPAFQFYADDFIGGTVAMTAEETGAYIRLLCFQWGTGAVPASQEACDRVAGCQVSAEVLAKFPNRKNPRMERERIKQEAYRTAQSESGRAGAKTRWGRHDSANGVANGVAIVSPLAKGMAKDSSPSPSPSPSPIQSSENTCEKASPPARERAPNPLFDALCLAEGSNPKEIGPKGGMVAKALQAIKGVTPDLTPEEIARRAANYRILWPTVTLTASALAKHWAMMGAEPTNAIKPRQPMMR